MADVAAGSGGGKRKAPEDDAGESGAGAAPAAPGQRRKRSRWDAPVAAEPAAAGGGASGGASSAVAKAKAALSVEALAKAKRALQVQKALQEKLKSLPHLARPGTGAGGALGRDAGALPPPGSATAGPRALRLDDQGREVDAQGRVVQPEEVRAVSALAMNAKANKLAAFVLERPPDEATLAESSFFDPRMGLRGAQRPRRAGFDFVEAGKAQEKIAADRAHAKTVEILNARKRAAAVPIAAAASAAAAAAREPDAVPEVEWWDKAILAKPSYDGVEEGRFELRAEKINIYVEHPVPLEPPSEAPAPPPQPLMLTAAERKKLRKQRREAREKERQDLLRQGLIEPPKPKVKISNLMRVLGTEATADPTMIEKEVREQMAERQQAHEDANEARRLTPAERREKKLHKLLDDGSVGTFVSVYRLERLEHPQQKYKVDINAQENHLTGSAVLAGRGCFAVVIVEGAQKAIRRYAKLMLRRVDWGTEPEDLRADEDAGMPDADGLEPEEKPPNKCTLVWQGVAVKPAFKRFRFEQCDTPGDAQAYLQRMGVGHYWDAAAACVEVDADL